MTVLPLYRISLSTRNTHEYLDKWDNIHETYKFLERYILLKLTQPVENLTVLLRKEIDNLKVESNEKPKKKKKSLGL